MQVSTTDEASTPRRREDDRLYEKLSLIIDSLDSLYKLDKREFLKKVFESAFELIPEAQKGSLYELDGERYRPIFARGYDFEVLSRISFSRAEALLHDIGKIGIPTEILRKPDRLDSAEYEIVERHPADAVDAMTSARSYRPASRENAP